jgi:hypothetical protein
MRLSILPQSGTHYCQGLYVMERPQGGCKVERVPSAAPKLPFVIPNVVRNQVAVVLCGNWR